MMIITLCIAFLTKAIECTFEPNTNTDFYNKENWGNNSIECPCNGINCTINFEEIKEITSINNLNGVFGNIKLPESNVVLEINGLFEVINSIKITHKVIIHSKPNYLYDICDTKLNEVIITSDQYAELLLTTPFNIKTITCDNLLTIKKNGYIENLMMNGLLSIEENIHLTVIKFIGVGKIIELNGLLLVSQNSSIVNTEIQFGRIDHEITKLIVSNDIQFEKSTFNISQFNGIYCNENPLTLVKSIFGIVSFVQSNYILDKNSYLSKDLSSKSIIQLQINSLILLF